MAAKRCRAARLALALLLAQPAWAWNGAGHRLVACVAWQRLGAAEQRAVGALLRQHPDAARWQRHAGDHGAHTARTAFIEASTWPDDIRRDRRFYSAGIDAPTPTLPGFPDMERRADWHYVNYPLPDAAAAGATMPMATVAPGAAISGRIEPALAELAQTLATGATPRAERSYALPWLIHLVADAHQPLHAATRVDGHGGIERGGPLVVSPFRRRQPQTSLHAYWDDLPGPPWLRGERLEAECRALAAAAEATPVASATPAQWLRESWQLARDHGYPPDDEAVPTISAEFDAQARKIARQRLAQAGVRLADLLRGLPGIGDQKQ